jgi:hypothetical protein
MRIAFALAGSKDPARTRISITFDKSGRNKWENLVGNMPREGNTLTVVNARVTVQSIVGNRASIEVALDPNIYVTGSSGGTLTISELPGFLR